MLSLLVRLNGGDRCSDLRPALYRGANIVFSVQAGKFFAFKM